MLAPFSDQPPELFAAPQLQLFFVHSFDPDDESYRLAVAGDEQPLVLRLLNTSVQRRLFDGDRLHNLFKRPLRLFLELFEQGLDLRFEGRQVVLQYGFDHLQVDVKVVMHQDMPHTDDL